MTDKYMYLCHTYNYVALVSRMPDFANRTQRLLFELGQLQVKPFKLVKVDIERSFVLITTTVRSCFLFHLFLLYQHL